MDENLEDAEAVKVISLCSSLGLHGRWNREVLDVLDRHEEVATVRCLAHSLQLVVKWGIKNSTKRVRTLIDLCRAVAKALRTQSVQNELKSRNLFTKHPRLDCVTRWSSTYLMVRFFYINLTYNIIKL